MDKVNEILSSLNDLYGGAGFEVHPFKISWYNENVDKAFQFDLEPDTLAVLVVSTPDMFDKALIPFICREDCTGSTDQLDRCMMHYFNLAKQKFHDHDIEMIHDFELTATRRPKILVQPAGHVAGAAYYYTRRCLNPDPFENKKKIFGVSIHPKYGGWFALRGVLIFKSVLCPDLPRREPVDIVPNQEDRARLLELFNYHWQDWRFRDIINTDKKYSEDQKLFFQTLPKDRKPLIQEFKKKYSKLLAGGDGATEKAKAENSS